MPSTPPARILIPLSLLSLLLHLAYVLSPLSSANFLPMDEGLYWDLASNIAEKGRFFLSEEAFATVGAGERTLFWTPVYPLFLAFVLKTGLPPLLLVQILQSAMAASLPLVLYPAAARFLQGRRLWIFLGLSAFYPYYFQLASQVASEVSAVFLALACLSLTLGPMRHSRPALLLLGTLAAWLCLTRPEYLVFAVVLMGWLAARLAREGGGRRALGRIGLLAVAFAAWTGPWLYRNFDATGSLVFTTRSGYSLAYQNEYYLAYTRGEVGSEEEWKRGFPRLGSEIERYRYLKARARDFIRKNPARYAALCGKRLASLFLPGEAKTLIYRLAGKRDIKPVDIPIWFRFSNLVFLAGLWLLTIPAAVLFLFRKERSTASWASPAGLLFLLVAGQVGVYTLFAYIEYQRSIMDLVFLLLGCALLSGDGAKAQTLPGFSQKTGSRAIRPK